MGDLGVRHSPQSASPLISPAAIIGLLYRAFGLLTGLPVRTLPDYAPRCSAAALCSVTTAVIWLGSCAPRSGRYPTIPSQK